MNAVFFLVREQLENRADRRNAVASLVSGNGACFYKYWPSEHGVIDFAAVHDAIFFYYAVSRQTEGGV